MIVRPPGAAPIGSASGPRPATASRSSPAKAARRMRGLCPRRGPVGRGAVEIDPPLVLGDPVVVDAGVAAPHVAVVGELPVLIAVASPPLSRPVAALVFEAHRDAVPLVA